MCNNFIKGKNWAKPIWTFWAAMVGSCTGILLPKYIISGFHFQQSLSDGITRKGCTGSNGTDAEPAQNCNKPLWDLKLDYKCSWLLKARQEKQTGETNTLLSSNKIYFNIFPGKSISSWILYILRKPSALLLILTAALQFICTTLIGSWVKYGKQWVHTVI